MCGLVVDWSSSYLSCLNYYSSPILLVLQILRVIAIVNESVCVFRTEWYIVDVYDSWFKIIVFYCNFFVVKYKMSQQLSLRNVSDQVYADLVIENLGSNAVNLNQCRNLTFRNCVIKNCRGLGFNLYECQNIQIINCDFENLISAVYAHRCSNITVRNSTCYDIRGPMPRGQFVQFNDCQGGYVGYNVSINRLTDSDQEDIVNMYKCFSDANNPTVIEYNYFQGGGPSASGGGIMLGDAGGSHLISRGNILVDVGQYGLAVAGGSRMTHTNNQVYCRSQPFTNVGAYVWAQNVTECNHITVTNNIVSYFNKDGVRNSWWVGNGRMDNRPPQNLTVSDNNWNASYTIPAIPSEWGYKPPTPPTPVPPTPDLPALKMECSGNYRVKVVGDNNQNLLDFSGVCNIEIEQL